MHCFILSCALSLLASPVIAAKAPASTKSSESPQALKARDKAQLAFQRDLVSVLAPRADALPLLGAALLARPLANQPSSNSFHTLIKRAAHADGADAAVSWIRLADCSRAAETCPNSLALKQLQAHAADNAAVWLIKLGVDARNMKQGAARKDLHKAANAELYDDYTGKSLQALADVVGALPPPTDTFDPTRNGGAIGMQTVLVFGIGSTQPQPSLPLVAQLCENSADDAAIKADCQKLGKVLEWGSSPLARSLGLHLREVLSDDPAQRQDARNESRNLVWQVQNFGELQARALDDAAVARQLLALARHGGTEMSLELAALRAYNIPTTAPLGWQPQQAD